MATSSIPSYLPAIYRRIQISAAEQALLVVLAGLANVQGLGAKIALEALAVRTGYTTRWVIILIQRLEARHLLRVHRTRLGFAWHAVNRYDLVQPWRREISYREALDRRQQQHRDRANIPAELRVHPEETKKENPPLLLTPDDEKRDRDRVLSWLNPGSRLYQDISKLPDPRSSQE